MPSLQPVIDLMEIAARTAPKSGGKDFIVVKVLAGDDLKRLADEMVKYGEKTKKKNFDRDARNVAASAAVVFVGIKDAKPVDLNCGACGFDLCNDRVTVEHSEFQGPSARSVCSTWGSRSGRRSRRRVCSTWIIASCTARASSRGRWG